MGRGFARLLDLPCCRRGDHPRWVRYRRDGHRIRGRPRGKFIVGEWPDDPSFRFLVHWALRREELCDPGLCPDAPDDDGQRCDCAEKGLLIRRALDLMGALKLGLLPGQRAK